VYANQCKGLHVEFFGKLVSERFNSFYEAYVTEPIRSVEVTFHDIPHHAPSIRGGDQPDIGYSLVENMPEKAEVHVRSSIPTPDFEHCLAHELLHVTSSVLQFPAAAVDQRTPVNGPEMGIAKDLLTIECAENDRLLLSLGFESGYVSSMRLQRLLQRITTTGANDDISRPWAARTTIHYLRALLDSGPEALSDVQETLGELPRIRNIGDQLYSLIEGRDLQDHGQRLLILVAIRDTLNLRGKIVILEPGEPVKVH